MITSEEEKEKEREIEEMESNMQKGFLNFKFKFSLFLRPIVNYKSEWNTIILTFL